MKMNDFFFVLRTIAFLGNTFLVTSGRRITHVIDRVGRHSIRGPLVLALASPRYLFFRSDRPCLVGQLADRVGLDFSTGSSLKRSIIGKREFA